MLPSQMTRSPSTPLEGTFVRLGPENPYRRLHVGDPGAGWLPWEEILSRDALLDDWYATILYNSATGRRDVAGSFLAFALTGTVVDVATSALLGERRAFSLAPADLALHRDGAGWCDGLAVRSPLVKVLPGDPAAAHPDASAALDRAALWSETARALAALLEPAFAAVRARAPFGVSGMWGCVSDQVGSVATRRQRAGGDAGLWEDAVGFLDALAAQAPQLRARPRLVTVAWEGGPSPFSIQGTCCLLYKTSPTANRATGAGYCSTCPLLGDEARLGHLIDWARKERS